MLILERFSYLIHFNIYYPYDTKKNMNYSEEQIRDILELKEWISEEIEKHQKDIEKLEKQVRSKVTSELKQKLNTFKTSDKRTSKGNTDTSDYEDETTNAFEQVKSIKF